MATGAVVLSGPRSIVGLRPWSPQAAIEFRLPIRVWRLAIGNEGGSDLPIAADVARAVGGNYDYFLSGPFGGGGGGFCWFVFGLTFPSPERSSGLTWAASRFSRRMAS